MKKVAHETPSQPLSTSNDYFPYDLNSVYSKYFYTADTAEEL